MKKSKFPDKNPGHRFDALTKLVSNREEKAVKDQNQNEQFIDPIEQAHELDAFDAPEGHSHAKDFGLEDQFVADPKPSEDDVKNQYTAEKSSPQAQFPTFATPDEESEAIVERRRLLQKYKGLGLYEVE